MKSWLKFFGLSFFSDKIAKEARIRGVLNCVLGFVLSLLFIYCGILAANTVSFYPHYDKASEFKDFVYSAVEKTGLTVKDDRISAENVINTFSDESGEEYSKNGYNLVIDTRPSDALAEFEAYCAPKSGEVDEISYEEYLALPDGAKENYVFKIRYTPNELVLTSDMVSGFESYLSASGNEDIKKQYSELSDGKGSLSEEDYNRRVYALYVKAYYPDITAYERAGEVPLVRSYYYRNYLNGSDINKCLFVFDDVLFGYFETDGGLKIAFYGSYGKVAEGTLTKDGADGFIKSAFASSVSVTATVYLMNIFRFIPIIVFMPLVLALIAKIVLTVIKDEKYKKYTTCFKIECSYLAAGSLITALIVFICGFFVSSGTLNVLPLAILAAVLAVRTAVLLVGEYFNVKKPPEKSNKEQPLTAESEAE